MQLTARDRDRLGKSIRSLFEDEATIANFSTLRENGAVRFIAANIPGHARAGGSAIRCGNVPRVGISAARALRASPWVRRGIRTRHARPRSNLAQSAERARSIVPARTDGSGVTSIRSRIAHRAIARHDSSDCDPTYVKRSHGHVRQRPILCGIVWTAARMRGSSSTSFAVIPNAPRDAGSDALKWCSS